MDPRLGCGDPIASHRSRAAAARGGGELEWRGGGGVSLMTPAGPGGGWGGGLGKGHMAWDMSVPHVHSGVQGSRLCVGSVGTVASREQDWTDCGVVWAGLLYLAVSSLPPGVTKKTPSDSSSSISGTLTAEHLKLLFKIV